ncbi:(2Fe-2S)-binding protein [Hydrococcus rivularis NIES-593]|uniref:(2Fe-2S)-binding protein n=1 Tax=Hydrococcus rivularis NIES-593 TaxID=1921803 RepID=A0A1U7H8X3_9CYAN|nr:copper chaperone Copz family protein [Hydrococcus rivularis]OKH19873.1 (2Fe-2S)-binding protein [Hydrococcus rivularis NIES-593]
MSEECCSQTQKSLKANCPVNGNKGKRVPTITLKSLLKPRALETLNPESNYFFCDSMDCSVVYFNQQGQTFLTDEVKVPVFQKDRGGQVPVCYCFNWTRDRILQEIQQTNHSTAESSIRTHIQAGRCGCEVNNPQGSCCLANVRKEVRDK